MKKVGNDVETENSEFERSIICWTGQFFLVIEFDRHDLTTRSSSLGQAGHTS